MVRRRRSLGPDTLLARWILSLFVLESPSLPQVVTSQIALFPGETSCFETGPYTNKNKNKNKNQTYYHFLCPHVLFESRQSVSPH